MSRNRGLEGPLWTHLSCCGCVSTSAACYDWKKHGDELVTAAELREWLLLSTFRRILTAVGVWFLPLAVFVAVAKRLFFQP